MAVDQRRSARTSRLLRVFVDQGEQAYAAAIMRPCADEVIASQMIPPLRS
jgi:hypothetical protein